MREFTNLSLRLLIITLIAGLLLGATYAITKDPIETQRMLKADSAIKIVLPDAESFEPIDLDTIEESVRPLAAYKALSGGDTMGYAFRVSGKGYAGDVVVTVGILSDGTIAAIEIGENKETSGLGSKAGEPEFKGQYAGKPAKPMTVVKNSPKDDEIAAITGATITSNAVTDAVNWASECYATIAGEGAGK